MDLIISHDHCPDGWAAAYIAKKKYPEAEILLLNHGIDPFPVIQQCVNKDVIMLDYSLRTRELNDKLYEAAKSFHIYDHHKSAQGVLEGAPYATFDMKRSGAGLAWDYLFGSDSEFSQDGLQISRPWYISYTEDQDLWNWALPNSREINAFLMVQEHSEGAWDGIVGLTAETARQLGIGVRQYIEYYTKAVIAESQSGILNFEGKEYKTAVLNIPYAGVSEAGNALVRDGKFDIGLLWFERGDGITQFSLRSNKDGSNVDVSVIAQSFGGGGHRNAAGFQVPLPMGRTVVDQVLNRPSPYWHPRLEEISQVIRRSPGGCA